VYTLGTPSTRATPSPLAPGSSAALAWAALLGAVAVLAGCGGDDDGSTPGSDSGVPAIDGAPPFDAPPGTADAGPSCDPVSGTPTLQLAPVASGLDEPTAAGVAPGSRRIFVTERPGRIRVIDGTGSLLATPFLDLTATVNDGGSEQGLLGLAFHPGYAQNRRLFVYYTRGDGDLVLAEYTAQAADENLGDPASGVPLLTIDHPQNTNHNGGWLGFGPDDKLYMATGDGGGSGDPFEAGQSLMDLRGKILRLDVDTAGQVKIPADNPFVGMGNAKGEIWIYGLRNPWRCSFDRDTGDLWIADVGQNLIEEIDFVPGTSMGGLNFGWDVMEGTTCFNETNFYSPLANCTKTGLTLPVLEYSHNGGAASITGGYVYRGCKMPALRGTYFYADVRTNPPFIKSLRKSGAQVMDQQNYPQFSNRYVYAFGEDADGELLVLDGVAGTVTRLAPE
jgi:hypothetical protein